MEPVIGGHLLDTSFVIDVWRGDAAAVTRLGELIAAGTPLYVNEVVVCELAAGLRPAELEAATRFLDPLEFIQPGPASAMLAGRWRADARARGHTVHLADALIAAAASAVSATVLTRNVRDFALVPVGVEPY